MRDEVTVSMAATPAAVWALLTDVTRIGELSPETFEAEWLGGATGPVPGAKFRGHVKRNGRGPTYWTVCRVDAAVPEREFVFTVLAGSRPVNTWGYRITPTATGCDVTEFFRLADHPLTRLYWALAGRWRGRTNLEGMRRTLERARAVVEA
jgi:uncharacterized protein YndB with AHSA1/START domain